MKRLLFVQKICAIIAAASFLGAAYSAQAIGCGPSGIPFQLVSENEPFVRVWLYRIGNTNLVQTVDYFTVDGPASFPARPTKAGVDYIAQSGTATFGIGQSTISVDVPLIDNGVVDGFRDFNLVLTNPATGFDVFWAEPSWIRIEDNEMESAVDPLFVPDTRAFVASMADGRVLSGIWSHPLPMMLKSNGWVDVSFATTLAASQSNVWLNTLQVLPDGRILAAAYDTPNSPQRLIRLLPDGALDAVITISNLFGFAAVQLDGKILVHTTTTNMAATNVILSRLNADGSPDAGFEASTQNLPPWGFPYQFAFQPDGKILFPTTPGLVRLNPNGSPDKTFSAPTSSVPILSFLLRGNGKVIVTYWNAAVRNGRLVQLNRDGSVDANFKLDPSLDVTDSVTMLEVPDGRLFAGAIHRDGFGAVMQVNEDGTVVRNLALVRSPPYDACGSSSLTLALAGPEQIYVANWSLTNVSGFPRRSFARLFTNPAEREFRILSDGEFSRNSGVVRLRVARTGASTSAASVSFTTADDTARAGVDYVFESSTLDFAPLEVSKEVTVPLLARSGVDSRLWFRVELKNASAGYTTIPSTPIEIIPELRISTDSLRPRGDGSIAITLEGTIPGITYWIENTSDQQGWYWWSPSVAQTAFGPATVFSGILAYDQFSGYPTPPPWRSPQFFRARRD